jgi:hypothetical protein
MPRQRNANKKLSHGFNKNYFERNKENFTPEFLRKPLKERLALLKANHRKVAWARRELAGIMAYFEQELIAIRLKGKKPDIKRIKKEHKRFWSIHDSLFKELEEIFSNTYVFKIIDTASGSTGSHGENIHKINNLARGFKYLWEKEFKKMLGS